MVHDLRARSRTDGVPCCRQRGHLEHRLVVCSCLLEGAPLVHETISTQDRGGDVQKARDKRLSTIAFACVEGIDGALNRALVY